MLEQVVVEKSTSPIVVHVTFSPQPHILSTIVPGCNYHWLLRKLSTTTTPTPAELSYKRKALHDQNPALVELGSQWQLLGPYWTSQATGRIRRGLSYQPVIGMAESVNLFYDQVQLDEERLFVINDRTLLTQPDGHIQRWEPIGSYPTPDGREEHHVALPILGKEDKGLGRASMRRWFPPVPGVSPLLVATYEIRPGYPIWPCTYWEVTHRHTEHLEESRLARLAVQLEEVA